MVSTIFSAIRLAISRPARAVLFARMAFWIILLSFAVKIYSLPKSLAILATAPREKDPRVGSTEDLVSAIDALLSLKFFVFNPICWKRAAVLHRYLALRGVVTTIAFGIRKGSDNQLDGHAWLVADGIPILEKETPNYTVTYIFPSQAPFEMELGQLAKT